MTMKCPICREKVEAGRPNGANGGWAAQVEPARLGYRHKNGEPLCPVMTPKGYQPAYPKGA